MFKTYWLAIAALLSVILSSCVTTTTTMTEEQKAERGAVVIVMKDVGDRSVFLRGLRVNPITGKFVADQSGFFMNVGDLPPGLLPAIFSNKPRNITSTDDKPLTAAYKNLPVGHYAFLTIYDESRSNCFDTTTTVFDVQPGHVNLVALPPSTSFLKKGFFKNKPETPPVDWDYSPGMSGSELVTLYETALIDEISFDMPVRASITRKAKFEPRSKPSISYPCMGPADSVITIEP